MHRQGKARTANGAISQGHPAAVPVAYSNTPIHTHLHPGIKRLKGSPDKEQESKTDDI